MNGMMRWETSAPRRKILFLTVSLFCLLFCISFAFAEQGTDPALAEPVPYPAEGSIGAEVVWFTHLEGGTGQVYYTFYLYKDSQLVTYAGPSGDNYFRYTPADGGTYRVGVTARDDVGLYVSVSPYFHVPYAPLTIKSVAANRQSLPVGYQIRWTVITSGGSGNASFGFSLFKDGSLLKSMTNTGGDNSFSYTPVEEGSYKVQVLAGDGTNTAYYESEPVLVESVHKFVISGVSSDQTTTFVYQKITWTVHASGGNGGIAFYYTLQKDGKDIDCKPLETSNVYSYTPQEPGDYRLNVVGLSGLEGQVCDSAIVRVIYPEGVRLTAVYADKNKAEAGETVTWTAASEGGIGNTRYSFSVYRDSTLLFSSIPGPSNSCTYTLSEPGQYRAVAYAQDDLCTDTLASAYLSVVPSKLTICSVRPSTLSAAIGTPVTWTVETEGGTGDIHYFYSLYLYNLQTYDYGLISTSEVTTSNTYTYIPDISPVHVTLQVMAGDGYDTAFGKAAEVYIAVADGIRVLSFQPDKAAAVIGDKITWTVVVDEAGTQPTNDYYMYETYFNGGHVPGAYSDLIADSTYTITADKVGVYSLKVSCGKIWPYGAMSEPVTVTDEIINDFAALAGLHGFPIDLTLFMPTLPPPVVATPIPTLPPPVAATPSPTLSTPIGISPSIKPALPRIPTATPPSPTLLPLRPRVQLP